MSQIIDSRYDIGLALKELLDRLFPGQSCAVSVSVPLPEVTPESGKAFLKGEVTDI
jgi:hypothetical protein